MVKPDVIEGVGVDNVNVAGNVARKKERRNERTNERTVDFHVP